MTQCFTPLHKNLRNDKTYFTKKVALKGQRPEKKSGAQ